MRIRTIKPDYFLDEDLDRVDERHQKLFQGLWGLADCEGRLLDAPKRIKAQVFPYRDYDVDAMLGVLHAGCFIDRYESGGTKCISIRNFRKHQRPHPKEPALGLPSVPPDVKSREKKFSAVSLPVDSPLQAGFEGMEGKGTLESKGREFAGSAAATPQPPNPRHSPLLKRMVDAYEQETGTKYAVDGKDVRAIQRLASNGAIADEEWERRWRIAIRDKFKGTKSIAVFASRPNDFVVALNAEGAKSGDIRRGPVRAEDQASLHGPPGEHSL